MSKQEIQSHGSPRKSAARAQDLDTQLPEFRNAQLDRPGGAIDLDRINVAGQFAEWCLRHDVLARKSVEGAILPLEGGDMGRIIEANAEDSAAGSPVPKDGHAAVVLGPAVSDLGVKGTSTAALATFYSLPDFTGWRVITFMNWCITRGLIPLVKSSPSSPPHSPKSSEWGIQIANNDPVCCAPGTKKEQGEDVIVVLP